MASSITLRKAVKVWCFKTLDDTGYFICMFAVQVTLQESANSQLYFRLKDETFPLYIYSVASLLGKPEGNISHT